MEARNTPSFTTAIRGYDREQVDEYVDSLAKALEDLEEAEDQNRRLQTHLSRLNARIHELEDRIRTETPHTAGALGERITLVLNEAEAGAARAIEEAQAKAGAMVEQAESKARTLESEAQSKHALVIAEAERRATARTRQVEEWEQQVVAHTHAQQAYQARVHEEDEQAHRERMADLAAEHEAAMAALRDVRDTVDHLLERAATSPAAGRAEADEDEVAEPSPPEEVPEEADASAPEVKTGEHPMLRPPAAFDWLAHEEEPEDSEQTAVHKPIEPPASNFRAVS